LKTGTQINISKSFFGKPPGFVARFGFCKDLREQRKNEKKYNNFEG
jgi:hypothetical protein